MAPASIVWGDDMIHPRSRTATGSTANGPNRRAMAHLGSALGLLLAAPASAALADWTEIPHGVVVRGPGGTALRVQAYGDDALRITRTPTADLSSVAQSLMVTAAPAGTVRVRRLGDALQLVTPKATVSILQGRVSIRNAAGQTILSETGAGTFKRVTVDGKPYVAIVQQFNRGTDEGFYGLGQHQKGQMDYNGEDVELAQHNTDIAIPFVASTRNYGLLWDNNSITRFGNPHAYALAGSDGLKVTGDGGKPGFTAHYYLAGKLAVARQEAQINYQFIKDQANWPDAAKARTVAATTGQNTAGNAVQPQMVVWTGRVSSAKPGLHRFQLYSSSYVKVFVDGRLVIDRWRQNWNPWFRDFDVPMRSGKPVSIRIEWQPNQGYMALLHNDPIPEADRHSLRFSSEVAKSIDYYVVTAPDMDGVVAGYRRLTGKAPIMPEWAYGFWQSRQRYETQAQLLDVVKTYRDLHIPIDNVVEDWFYWKPDQWGSHEFDRTRFPDPQGMIDALHAQNAHFMISVWAKFYPTTANFQELAAVNGVYRGNLDAHRRDWVGYPNTVYDPYNPQARAIYWRQMKERLAVLGIDGWWMDATEPDVQSNLSIPERMAAMGPTYAGPAAAFFNSFPLVHGQGVAQGLADFAPDKRSFILTRSAFGGLQRTGSAIWSGDTAARWDDFRDQIAAGVNASLSGIPNWTFDIGGFSVEDRYSKQDPAALDEWRELNLRWFQFGALAPIFRSHGEFPHREIYELAPEGSTVRDALIWYDRLRYRLMPYLYSLGAATWFDDGSIMRGLVMDFPADRTARGVNDQYLLGRSLLVAPVTAFQARSRSVYLPAAGWYDFYTGHFVQGGRTIQAEAPAERMPLFVRAGSIVPIGQPTEWTRAAEGAPITLLVYRGADGRFTLYNDDGVSNGYKKGDYARIPIMWDDHAGTLSIGTREGHYPGMPQQRFIIRFVSPQQGGDPLAATAPHDRVVDYSGDRLSIRPES